LTGKLIGGIIRVQKGGSKKPKPKKLQKKIKKGLTNSPKGDIIKP
jgi:hypothetical protein